MTTHPNCKINLGLHIVGRRPDGYHELQTIFLPVHDLCDELTIHRADHTEMVQTGIALDNAPDDNLCVRAWRLLHDEYDIPPVSISLTKRIPFGAGLGGGSSDAAFTLKMLNEMFALGLDNAHLEHHAAQLGADCPFFVGNKPAYATGIGDVLSPIELPLPAAHYTIRIEIPDHEHVSTKEAYAGLKDIPTLCSVTQPTAQTTQDSGFMIRYRPDLREAIRRPISEWRELIVNDFEASVFPAHPAIAALKADMYRCGALYASMTGSGAAVFGIFER